ncbi:MAG: dihydroorotase [Candidatus Aminicenantes bacterium]|nr:dihydroorotase [Candidatus Aminicenantes bacterium]
MKRLIRNGRLIDPRSRTDAVGDVLLDGGRIAAVGGRIRAAGAEVIDASGLVVAPGFIDMHVHLREPGQTHKETIRTGARAAARGGFTSICAMPNTAPVNDAPEVTAYILKAAAEADVHVFPIAALSRGLQGEEPVDFDALLKAGAVAFSDDGRCIQDASLMRRVMKAARALNTLVIDHCEDRAIFKNGVVNEGSVSQRLNLPGIPASAENTIVARDIALSEALGSRVHIAHLSTRGAARLVGEAKRRGLSVTAEVTPHHLLLSENEVEAGGPNFKMNPPLRRSDDVSALIEAVRRGDADVFATDHAPHTAAEKAAGLRDAPFGIVGLETAVSLLLDRLVRPGLISLLQFVTMWSFRPAEILRLPGKGRLSSGADADLTLLDLERAVTVDATRFASLGRNTPFDGWILRGAPVMTIVGGRTVFSDVTC